VSFVEFIYWLLVTLKELNHFFFFPQDKQWQKLCDQCNVTWKNSSKWLWAYNKLFLASGRIR